MAFDYDGLDSIAAHPRTARRSTSNSNSNNGGNGRPGQRRVQGGGGSAKKSQGVHPNTNSNAHVSRHRSSSRGSSGSSGSRGSQRPALSSILQSDSVVVVDDAPPFNVPTTLRPGQQQCNSILHRAHRSINYECTRGRGC